MWSHELVERHQSPRSLPGCLAVCGANVVHGAVNRAMAERLFYQGQIHVTGHQVRRQRMLEAMGMPFLGRRRDHEQVIWTATDSSQQVRFPAAQYDAEVERALRDHTWETPERTASRLISQAVDRTVLARRGFEFSWASGRCRDGMMTASVVLTPGPYQVLVSVAWDGENIDGIVAHFAAILSQSPERWPNVECNAQVKGLEPPPITGPGWNRKK